MAIQVERGRALQRPLMQPRLVEQVYSSLLEAICDGSLPSGVRLTQEWLAERLDVSRQPIGQALALLKSQGFVCEVGRRGLMVAPLKPQFVQSIYAVRGALDRLAARRAAERRHGAHAKARGEGIVKAGRKALRSGSIAELITVDIEFHAFVYELSGNPIIGETMALLWNRLRRVMSAYLKHSDWADDIWKEHGEIIRLIFEGDPEGAERMAGAHVDNAIRLLQDELSAAERSSGAPGALKAIAP